MISRSLAFLFSAFVVSIGSAQASPQTSNDNASSDAAEIAPMTLADAGGYMQSVIQNYVNDNSVHGLWQVKEGTQIWNLKLQEVVDDSTIKLGQRAFVSTGLCRTAQRPYHHVDIDFVVDFSKTPWTVTRFVVLAADGKELHPRPAPAPDADDAPAPAVPNGPAAEASSKE